MATRGVKKRTGVADYIPYLFSLVKHSNPILRITLMTAINTSEIPAVVDSAEELVAYAAMLLARVNPDLRILEVPGGSQKAIEMTIISADEVTTRLIGRFSIALNPEYATDTSVPLYAQARELSNTPAAEFLETA